MVWLYVPGLAGSKEESSLHSEAVTNAFATSRGRFLQPRAWRAKWKRDCYTRHLSGMTCDLLTAQRGVDEFKSLLPVFHASRAQSPARDSEPQTSDGCGATSSESSARSNRGGSSSKTSPVCSLRQGQGWGNLTAATLFEAARWERFLGDWPRWGSLRNGAVFRRAPLDLRRGGCGGSVWPTALTADSVSARNRTSGRKEGSQHHDGVTLTDAIQLWATPTAHERTHEPRAVDHGEQLANQVSLWATPTTSDHKQDATSQEEPVNALLGRQAPRMTEGGKWFLPLTPNSPLRFRLSPRFVAWLQGIPWSWITPDGLSD